MGTVLAEALKFRFLQFQTVITVLVRILFGRGGKPLPDEFPFLNFVQHGYSVVGIAQVALPVAVIGQFIPSGPVFPGAFPLGIKGHSR